MSRGVRQISDKAILKALRSSPSVAAAAKAAGCSRALIQRRVKSSPELQAALDDLNARRVGGSSSRTKRRRRAEVRGSVGESPDGKLALETLREVCRTGTKEDGVRVTAAKELLRYEEARLARAHKVAAKQDPEAPAAPRAKPAAKRPAPDAKKAAALLRFKA